MNKLLVFPLVLVLWLTGSLFAQGDPTGMWSAGFDFRGNLPMGDFKNITDFGVGGTGYVSYNVAPQVAITGRAGYIYFGGKEYSITTTGGTVTAKTNYSIIPIIAGVKIFFSDGDSRVYVAGETGMYILSASVDATASGGGTTISGGGGGNETKFGVSPSLGAQFKAGDKMLVDAHANFSNVFTDESSTNWITFAIGFEWLLN